MEFRKRWLLVVLILGILLASVGLQPQTAQASAVLFWDSFSGDLSRWSVQRGAWKIVNGAVEGVGSGGGLDGYLYAGDSIWTDYSITTKVTFISGQAEFRLRSTGLFQNEYRISIWADNSAA